MKDRINSFVDLFPDFHSMDQTEQILRIVYFHTIEEKRESVNRGELETLFRMSEVAVPRNLPQLLGYLCGKGKKLLSNDGEFSLRREVKKNIEDELRTRRGVRAAPATVDGLSPFDFPGRTFSDKKIATLLDELRRCYDQGCWNACGLLIRIVVERTLDAVDPTVKAKSGLKDKINRTREVGTVSKSLREGLEHLQGAKIFGDIAAHHSKMLLDRPDVNLVLPTFRVLLKEVTSI